MARILAAMALYPELITLLDTELVNTDGYILQFLTETSDFNKKESGMQVYTAISKVFITPNWEKLSNYNGELNYPCVILLESRFLTGVIVCLSESEIFYIDCNGSRK